DLLPLAGGGDVAPSDLAPEGLGNWGIGRTGGVVVEGPPVLLRSKAAISLGMALRELASNASRDGALSVPQGRVRLSWSIEAPDMPRARLVIHWQETD